MTLRPSAVGSERSDSPWKLIELATSGDEYLRFAPYVASIDDDGRVAFQAKMRSGQSRVVVDGEVLEPTQKREEACSHPAISRDGLSYYATLGDASVLIRPGQLPLGKAVGPLGPTINDSGEVAYRVKGDKGEGVRIARDSGETVVADESAGYSSFVGLPDINNRGEVVFRAEREGVAGLYRYQDGEIHTIAAIGSKWKSLAGFPHNDEGAVGFVGGVAPGVSGLYRESQGEFECLLDTRSDFHSFRGLLLAGDICIFYGTPRGEPMGLFSLRSGVIEPILSVGDSWQGSTITAFALNPVSINRSAQLAIRIELGKRESILRAQL